MKLEPSQADPNTSRIRKPFIPAAANGGGIAFKITYRDGDKGLKDSRNFALARMLANKDLK